MHIKYMPRSLYNFIMYKKAQEPFYKLMKQITINHLWILFSYK